ncbi:hypothetical protein BDN70DRAFT_438037 [Pholiota conissans]|uniref:Uncharacterized protein n=1 Tax=Pholiota conissans TaxID=109636 RepID=A0A9P6D494_9AGAR|nr:hypothetical protein BDN70DRAFT_438037 [Pholiota conissans]
MSSSTAQNTLTRPYLNNLLHVLRSANQRYATIAASMRESMRPTFHARKRAQMLMLRVDIDKADALDQQWISTIPLPILERTTTSPSSSSLSSAPRRRPVRPRIVIPEGPEVYTEIALGSPMALSAKVVGREREIRRRSVHAAEPAPEAQRASTSIMDLLKIEASVVLEAPLVAADGRLYWASDVQEEVECVKSREERGARLDVPSDVDNRLSWGSDISSSSSGVSDASSSSSSGLMTPESSAGLPKLTIRIKRKSSMSIDTDDELVASEKRPKYERKEWVRPTTRRSITRPFSVSSSASASSSSSSS